MIEHDYESDAEGDGGGGGGSDDASAGGKQQAAVAGESAGAGKAAASDPETVFMQEVGETFLRCVKERFAETNAVIELNGLKIAEDRTFADCARYIFTAMMQVKTMLMYTLIIYLFVLVCHGTDGFQSTYHCINTLKVSYHLLCFSGPSAWSSATPGPTPGKGQ